MAIRAGVITISDKGFAGEREDRSGPVLREGLQAMDIEVVRDTILPDEPDQITVELISWADAGLDVIITTGGTGPTPRDQTPEATLAAIDRQMPGIAEVLRAEGYKKTPLAVLSRGVCGLRGKCLIINLPGSTKAVAEGLATLEPILPHAVRMAQGVDTEHHHGHDHGEHDHHG